MKDSLQLDDTLATDESQLSEDLLQWPKLEFGDFYTYLIETKGVYIKEKLKAYKSLEAYNYYHNVYLRIVYHFAIDNYSILQAKVNPGQRAAESNHDAWVILNRDTGSLKTGHCTCMAGQVVISCRLLLLAVWVKSAAMQQICYLRLTLLTEWITLNHLEHLHHASGTVASKQG